MNEANIENLFQKSNLLVRNQQQNIVRSMMEKIDWTNRLIGILGARGTGKTTLLLQYARGAFGPDNEVLYLTLDDIYFSENRLSDVAARFSEEGGKLLLLDEVHKYPNWAREIKNSYDFYQDLKIIFTGSSISDMLRQNTDLSRRAVQYYLPGLSFREFLQFTGTGSFPAISLRDIVDKHVQIAGDMSGIFKPLLHFQHYLRYGYYPFFKENIHTYPIRLEQVVKMVIETDLQFVEGFSAANTRKIYQLLYILSVNVPFKPNVSKLSEKIGITRNTLVQYIYYLEKAKLINTLSTAGKSISILQKPDKIYLENTNLQYALSPETANKGTLRETFFLNQHLNAGYDIALPPAGDFKVNDQYVFETGGRGKTMDQVKDVPNAYVAADDMETGALRKIPLWLFGWMY
ncbi:MAG: AAA family ATPase [Chitinophagaceae bacterium]